MSLQKQISCLRQFSILTILCQFISPSSADTFTEDFKSGSNEAGWTFCHKSKITDFCPEPTIINEPESQNAHLQFEGGTWAPIAETGHSQSIFLGNYRSKKVTKLAAHVKWFDKYISTPGTCLMCRRPFSIVLISGQYAAVKLSDTLLDSAINQWVNFEFTIPTAYDDLKNTGWRVVNWPETAVLETDDHFEEILHDVQKVQFYYADPGRIYFIWDFLVGITHISIMTENTIIESHNITPHT